MTPVEPPDRRSCIEVRSLLDTVRTFSVEAYEAALSRGQHLRSRALSFHELMWTVDAPPVEALSREWV